MNYIIIIIISLHENYRGQVPDLIALFTRQFKELAHKAIRPGSLLTRAIIR